MRGKGIKKGGNSESDEFEANSDWAKYGWNVSQAGIFRQVVSQLVNV